MHITLISACERRAIRRSNAILDSYAIRTGEKSWQTPITTEAMRELRAALRRTATRQTAVACYVNEGMRRMRLLWIVGSQNRFGLHGAYPVGYTQRKQAPAPDWLRPVALLARLAGLIHDIGKASTLFQEKLRAANPCQADPVRHEWISLLLYRHWREGMDQKTAWATLPDWFGYRAKDDLSQKLPWLENGLTSLEDALEFLVVSHHHLLGAEISNCSRDDKDNGPFFRHYATEARSCRFVPQAELPPDLFREIETVRKRLHHLLAEKPADYWWPLALQARAALIFADHKVSGDPDIPCKPQATLHANTFKQGETRRLKQPLDEHLFDVARTAGDAAYQMATLHLPALSPEAANRICEPAAASGRFVWQNRAADLLEQLRQHSTAPVLLFNLAGTGSGKTRMNARAACLLGRENRIRFANVLNLRTLTLQTGDAFREQLGIGADEMATVIGSKLIATLHNNQLADEDENGFEPLFTGRGEIFTLPHALAHLGQRQPTLIPVIAAPVLVATIDYLIAAGEPNRQGHHVSAWLRLMDSDLILDEIDSYDPEALVAVLRLIQIAAMSGRNVICASATLALPIAKAVHRAFGSGLAMRQQLQGHPCPGQVVLIDDLLPPQHFGCDDDFTMRYAQHIKKLCNAMGNVHYRVPYRQIITCATEGKPGLEDWLHSITLAAQTLHRNQQWQTPGGKSVSFGLIRIANIRTAVQVARHLLQTLPEAQIACYHANDLVIQRHYKEARLDWLLNRKAGNQHIESDPEINALLQASPENSIPFIVVATPVEEIGRDHDFDWAVIEPSFAQSIVQTAGRVNRHRLLPCHLPNIALLDANARLIREDTPVFYRPGLESSEYPYGKNSPKDWRMVTLLDKTLFTTKTQAGQNLDARLRFDTNSHKLSWHDDESLETRLQEPLSRLCPATGEALRFPSRRLAERFYTDYPLRGYTMQESYRVNEADVFERLTEDKYQASWSAANSKIRLEPTNRMPWLALDFAALRQICTARGVDEKSGLQVDLPVYNPSQSFTFSVGLGFWPSRNP